MQVSLMWLVWRKRNNCTFKDVESPIDHLNSLQIQTLFDWSWVCGFTHCTSLSGFQHSFRISI